FCPVRAASSSTTRPSTAMRAAQVAAGISAGVVVYAAVGFVLRVEEFRDLASLGRRKGTGSNTDKADLRD
ncbi:MAG: hypothetical protein WBQ66_21330, partial [Blastocatellia bacterium]